jgi:hypothetical protein
LGLWLDWLEILFLVGVASLAPGYGQPLNVS